MELSELAARAAAVLDEIERAVVGKRDRLELVLAGLLADGHVLLEDVPGLAKTLTARSFATVTGLRFARVQFTPDLLPSDVTGSSIWNQRDATFDFRPGPVFTNVLLADEINRAPPKTQAALLEAMQERQVSIDGTHARARAAVPRPRHAEPDRVRGHLPAARRRSSTASCCAPASATRPRTTSGSCSRGASTGRSTRSSSRPVVDRATLLEMQRAVEGVHVDESVGRYVVELVCGDAREPQRLGRLEPARLAGAPQALALPRRARRPRLRDAGRREGGRGAGPRPPPRAPTRALGAAADGRGRRARAPRRGADADDRDDAGGVTRSADARLVAYATLAAAGLLAALALRRAELALLATPFALLVALGVRASGPTAPRLARPRPRAGARGRGARRDPHGALPDRRRPPRAGPRAPTGARGRRGPEPRGPAPRARGGARAAASAALRALGDRRGRRPPPAGARPDRARAVRGPHRPHPPAADLPHPRASPPGRLPRPHAGGDGQRGRADPRRGARVRRHAPVRERRPAPVGQLARDGPTRQPRRQRAPSRSAIPTSSSSSTASRRRGSAPRARSSTPSGSPRRSRTDSSSGATASGSSPSAASCAGSSRRRASSSSTGSWTRSSRPRSSSATRGRT